MPKTLQLEERHPVRRLTLALTSWHYEIQGGESIYNGQVAITSRSICRMMAEQAHSQYSSRRHSIVCETGFLSFFKVMEVAFSEAHVCIETESRQPDRGRAFVTMSGGCEWIVSRWQEARRRRRGKTGLRKYGYNQNDFRGLLDAFHHTP